MDFAKLSDVDKEKVKALVRQLAREKKDGPDVPDLKQTEDETADRKSEEGNVSTAPQASGEDGREKLVAEYLRRVESVYGQGKEARMMAASARPIRNTRTGYAYISITDAAQKTGLSARDIHSSCVSNGWQGGEWRYISQTEYAKLPEEQIEVETKNQKAEEEKSDDIAPAAPQAKDESESDIPQAASEDKDEEERLMAEYWRRAKKVYGNDPRINSWVKTAKPVCHARNEYVYISVQDAAQKTGYSANYIHHSCLRNNSMGGAWCYITKEEYARTPEEMTEVETRDQRTKEGTK